VCGVSTDITEQTERERALEGLKDRLELAVEGAKIGVWDWDLTSDEVEFNDQWAEMLGYSLDEVEPRLDAWERRVHPDDLAAVEDALSEHIAGETEYYETEHRMRTASGEWNWIRDVGKVVERDGAGEPVRAVGIHLDIDDRKRREEELIRTRQVIERTQQSATIGWWEVDLVDGSLTWSDEVYRIHEVPRDEPVEIAAALEFYHPDDRDAIETAFERLRTAGEPYDVELRIVTAAGRTRWVRAIGDPRFDDAGDAVGALGLFQDVTERKEYELTLEKQRDALTLLNEVVRHDIRNQLMVVESYTELLDDSLVDDQGRTYAETVIAAARQASDITETAREVTEVLLQVGTARAPMRLRAELGEQVAALRENRDRTTVAVDEPIPDVTVLADELLRSVFRNILVNAIVHNDKEAVEIGVSTEVSDETVRVSIADNGPGIADKHKEQIYQEGESGLESGGTGVGLYLVKTLVERYGGDVWVEDNEPTGSVFVVELPRAD
jgi:PAS domain S-box-containing protein